MESGLAEFVVLIRCLNSVAFVSLLISNVQLHLHLDVEQTVFSF